MSDLEQPKPSGISRRTVAKAMAWSVPAVALAVPAPAYAASGQPPVITPGLACKAPGNSCNPIVKGYAVYTTVYNPDPTQTIYITDVVINQNTSGLSLGLATIPGLPLTVGPEQTVQLIFNATSSNSANADFTLGFLVTWGHESDGSDTDHADIQVTVVIPATPPDCCKE